MQKGFEKWRGKLHFKAECYSEKVTACGINKFDGCRVVIETKD